MIKKTTIHVCMLFFAAIIAGSYGALHNQISYSFSPEYFTQLKFMQLDIPWAQDSPRIGAAYVGALSSWWMGVLICMILSLFGYRFETPKDMAIHLGKSFTIVVIVAFFTGIVGLVYGYYEVNQETISEYAFLVRKDVTDPIQFVRVGFMHDSSYLGGVLGLLFGVIYLVISKKRLMKS